MTRSRTGRRNVVGLTAKTILLSLGLSSGLARFPKAQTLTVPPAVASFGDDEYVIGDPNAPVTVIEYLSVTCSHCAAFDHDVYPDIDRLLLKTGQVRLIVRELSTSPVVLSSAGFILARCQGTEKYWNIVRRLLAHQRELAESPSLASGIALETALADLTSAEAEICLSNETAISQSNARRQRALDAGVEATPSFLFYNVSRDGSPPVELRLSGDVTFAEFQNACSKVLKMKSKQQSHRDLTNTPLSH